MTATGFPLISGDSVLGAFLASATDADLPPLLISDDDLAKFRADLGPALLAEIQKAGLDAAVLFAIYRLHYEHWTRPAERARVPRSPGRGRRTRAGSRDE